MLGELHHLVFGEVIQVLGLAGAVVDLLQQLAQLGRLGSLQHVADALTRPFAPTRGESRDLADIHPRRHAERIQHDVHRGAIGHVRMSRRNDARHDALVAVTAGHLVARLQAALDGQVHLDHLQHARRSSSPCVSFFFLSSKAWSNCLRLSSIESLSDSSCAAASSSARRISNQCTSRATRGSPW